MFCKECGENLEENAKFCSNCGTRQPEKELLELVVDEKLQEKSKKDGIKSEPPEEKEGAGVCKPIELEEKNIKNVIHISVGEELIFNAKLIKIYSDIHCEGELIFDNCVIIYNGVDIKGNIRMECNTKLKISNCTIVGINERHTKDIERYLIEGYNNTSKLLIENNLFCDCLRFARKTETKISNCIIKYQKLPPPKSFLFECDSSSNSVVENSVFFSLESDKEIMSRIIVNHKYGFSLKHIYSDFNFDLENYKTENEAKEAYIKYFGVNTLDEADREYEKMKDEVKKRYSMEGYSWSYSSLMKNIKAFSKCTFKNISFCFTYTESVLQCKFVNCIGITNYNSKLDISNCSFVNCADVLQANNLNLRYCQFFNCSDNIVTVN
jgi:RNA polymerase subunit RPABC4/transcription elongation factor Spt4